MSTTTLSVGNLLAKVYKDADGNLKLVEGEGQHLFEVTRIATIWYGTGNDVLIPDLRVLD